MTLPYTKRTAMGSTRPAAPDTTMTPDPLREALRAWAKDFLDGLAFNVPALQAQGWPERRAQDLADSILADEGVRAALAAQPEPLDAERLARAMWEADTETSSINRDVPFENMADWGQADYRQRAAAIAREYAALEEPTP